MTTTDKTIMVVDDSLTIRMQVKDLLEDEGYQVILAEDGETCLELLKTQTPDIILLDIVLPGISGLGVCKAIKESESLCHIPVLILTHVSDSENKVAGLKVGADDYVTKPFAIEELNARISAILNTKALQQELIAARDAAQQSASAKSSFLANMSHEIRTPMNGVVGFIELLMETDLDSEQKEYVEAIHRSGKSLLIIINDILDFSKLESGDLSLEEINFDLAQVISDVSNLIKPKLQDKPVEIEYRINPEIPQIINGDPHRLRQVLLNILGNSAKFTKKGKIRSVVKLEKKEEKRIFLHFELKDTGIGIPSDKVETIFELFTQADSSTTREYGGTGLGLSIARKLSQKTGGNCWAESEPGKGSIFHVTGWFKMADEEVLPEKQDLSKNNETENRNVFIENREPAKILLAEDNLVNQLLAKKLMGKMGHQVDVADNGKIAFDKYAKAFENNDLVYDIIFMDMQMPEMDGIEATKIIREKEKALTSESNNLHIPIIAMTANVLKEHRKMCFDAGMDDFVAKPIGKDLVNNIIQKWVK